jgi:putative sterol carrier protein
VVSFDPGTYANIGPVEFASLVKSTPKAELEAVLAGDDRAPLLDAIFARIPGQFRPDNAAGQSAVIEWNITGGPNGTDTFQVTVADGACTVSRGATAEPRVAFSLGGVEFLNLITGQSDPMMMFMTGKVKVKGDMVLAASIPKLFDMPKG